MFHIENRGEKEEGKVGEKGQEKKKDKGKSEQDEPIYEKVNSNHLFKGRMSSNLNIAQRNY